MWILSSNPIKSLLDKIPRENARQALESQKEKLQMEYSALKQGEKSNEDAKEPISPISKITIENMFAVIRRQQQFIEELLRVLEDESQ